MKKLFVVSTLAIGIMAIGYLAYNSLSQLGLDVFDLEEDWDEDESIS